jgi:hypothetical protein
MEISGVAANPIINGNARSPKSCTGGLLGQFFMQELDIVQDSTMLLILHNILYIR